MTPSWLSDIVQCPDCSAPVTTDFFCSQCARALRQGEADIFDATPNPQRLADLYGDRLSDWHAAQQQLTRWRQQRPPPDAAQQGLSPDMALLYLELAQTSPAARPLLDVGCSDGRRRTHFPGKRYIGLDPIPMDHPLPFPRFTGLAEHLPFCNAVFDAVLCVEVLDHVIAPDKALLEMIRTLTPDGALFVFVGTTQCDEGQAAYRKRQTRFTITEDQVHLHQFTSQRLQQILTPHFKRIECLSSGGYLACLAQLLR